MADNENEFVRGFIDDRRHNKGQQTVPLGTQQSTANYNSVGLLRARLGVVNAGYYSATRLNSMTKNDMIYAVRQADDAAGIK